MKKQLKVVKCCSNCKYQVDYEDAPECSLSDEGVEHYNICDNHVFKVLRCLDCSLLNRKSRICELSNTFMGNAFEQCKLGKTFYDWNF